MNSKFLATEIAWLAGLFEGEGSCGVYKNNTGFTPKLAISQHERSSELLYRAQEILKAGHVHGPYVNSTGTPVMTWSSSKIEEVYKIITLIYPWLSARRQGQCDVVVEYIKSTKKFNKGK